jgi:hypothetical protein
LEAIEGECTYIQVFVHYFRACFKEGRYKNEGKYFVEYRVAVILSRLGTGNTLMMVGDLFGLGLSTTSEIVRKCCKAIRIHLKPLVFKKPTLAQMKQIASEFEALHGIPYILGAIDGSHIPIIAPPYDPVSYYCRKGFYLCLLQGVVDAKCKFWD